MKHDDEQLRDAAARNLDLAWALVGEENAHVLRYLATMGPEGAVSVDMLLRVFLSGIVLQFAHYRRFNLCRAPDADVWRMAKESIAAGQAAQPKALLDRATDGRPTQYLRRHAAKLEKAINEKRIAKFAELWYEDWFHAAVKPFLWPYALRVGAAGPIGLDDARPGWWTGTSAITHQFVLAIEVQPPELQLKALQAFLRDLNQADGRKSNVNRARLVDLLKSHFATLTDLTPLEGMRSALEGKGADCWSFKLFCDPILQRDGLQPLSEYDATRRAV